MTTESPTVLEELLRKHQLSWALDIFGPASRAHLLETLLAQLDKTAQEYERRVGDSVGFTPEILAKEAARQPHKIRAFLQALVTAGTAEMLVMVWRVLQGLHIRRLDMRYNEEQSFDLTIVLGWPAGEEDRPYRSEDINDASLVRHLGITTIDDKPLFSGFFTLPQQ